MVVVDHGVFAVADVKLGQWPVVVPTAPKHAGILVESDDWRAFVDRGVVRAVVFSPAEITSVVAHVDGVMVGPLSRLSQEVADPRSRVFEARVDWKRLAQESGVDVFGGQHTLTIVATVRGCAETC